MSRTIDPELGDLVKNARAAAGRAYAPYSGFRVGAAILATNGKVFTGCNVENASYGLTVCAERSAVLAAVGAGAREFKAIAVVGGRDEPAFPCGACLQVLAEFCGPDLDILLVPIRKTRVPLRVKLKDLLPRSFALR